MASLTYAHGSFTGVITAVWRDYPVSEPRPLPIDLVAHWRNREIIGRSNAHSASEAQAEFEKALEAAYAEELALL